ncbi:MAG: hypothetical protein M3R68_03075 [Acidobacteriota bacterium]|nr:hypothetical protein [Acidobacteriota bacterium]
MIRKNIEIVRVLLAKGALVNDQDLRGRKPVDWAHRLNFVEIEAVLRTAK